MPKSSSWMIISVHKCNLCQYQCHLQNIQRYLRKCYSFPCFLTKLIYLTVSHWSFKTTNAKRVASTRRGMPRQHQIHPSATLMAWVLDVGWKFPCCYLANSTKFTKIVLEPRMEDLEIDCILINVYKYQKIKIYVSYLHSEFVSFLFPKQKTHERLSCRRHPAARRRSFGTFTSLQHWRINVWYLHPTNLPWKPRNLWHFHLLVPVHRSLQNQSNWWWTFAKYTSPIGVYRL